MIYGIAQMAVLVTIGQKIEEEIEMEQTRETRGLKYITCDCCGRRIHEGDDVYYTSGIVYQCCSASCLAHMMIDVRRETLSDEYTERELIEWEGKED